MSQQFKTQAEIWQALIDGKKIQNKHFGSHTKIYLKHGFQIYESGVRANYSFGTPEDWSIYEPPKPKKILKPFLIEWNGGIVDSAYFENASLAQAYCHKYSNKFLGPAKGIPDQEVEEV